MAETEDTDWTEFPVRVLVDGMGLATQMVKIGRCSQAQAKWVGLHDAQGWCLLVPDIEADTADERPDELPHIEYYISDVVMAELLEKISR
jgi:hypothetical protein